MDAAPPGPGSSSDATHQRLREDIIFGRLAPGQKLRLERLRDDYAVSVATLREVMSRLAAEGLILFEAQKGFEVAALSVEDLREISDMRALLECHAIGPSFAAGDLEWEAGVVAAHHKLSRLEAHMMAGEPGITATWKRYDREFHRALIAGCGSGELLATHQRIFDRFQRYQVLLVMFRGQTAIAEHDALLSAALARDAMSARAILRRHIGACIEHTLAHGLIDGMGAP